MRILEQEDLGNSGLDQVGGAPLLQDFPGSAVQPEARLGGGAVPPRFTSQGFSSPTHENLWGDSGDAQGTVGEVLLISVRKCAVKETSGVCAKCWERSPGNADRRD